MDDPIWFLAIAVAWIAAWALVALFAFFCIACGFAALTFLIDDAFPVIRKRLRQRFELVDK